MKVFTLVGDENWILDRWAKEWAYYNPDLQSRDPQEADVIWILADWSWRLLPVDLLERKKTVITVQHITPHKFKGAGEQEFRERDRFADLYQVPCRKTYDAVRPYTEKEIVIRPHWVNQALWRPLTGKAALRARHGIRPDSFLIGSFQRDTEGSDLVSPKLEKGPDIFCEAALKLRTRHPNLEVVLAGWRRQYVMRRLTEAGIRYYYFELPTAAVLNELYNVLDLYVVSSRWEGGPQAIVECACCAVPLISTDVGLASDLLPRKSIFAPEDPLSAEPDVEYSQRAVKPYLIPEGFLFFRELFARVAEGAQ